jgi:hypothetical protein
MRRTALTLTVIGLAGTAAVHVWQYLSGYEAAPNGWMFLAQPVAAIAILVLVVRRGGIAAPAAAAALQFGSLVALGLAFTGVFLGFTEAGLRLATVLTIVVEVAGLAGAVALVVHGLQHADEETSARELLVG